MSLAWEYTIPCSGENSVPAQCKALYASFGGKTKNGFLKHQLALCT